jgi:hypothetical protein
MARVPTEIVKQRAQTTPNRGIGQIAREIYANSAGIRGFYKGTAHRIQHGLIIFTFRLHVYGMPRDSLFIHTISPLGMAQTAMATNESRRKYGGRKALGLVKNNVDYLGTNSFGIRCLWQFSRIDSRRNHNVGIWKGPRISPFPLPLV